MRPNFIYSYKSLFSQFCVPKLGQWLLLSFLSIIQESRILGAEKGCLYSSWKGSNDLCCCSHWSVIGGCLRRWRWDRGTGDINRYGQDGKHQDKFVTGGNQVVTTTETWCDILFADMILMCGISDVSCCSNKILLYNNKMKTLKYNIITGNKRGWREPWCVRQCVIVFSRMRCRCTYWWSTDERT